MTTASAGNPYGTGQHHGTAGESVLARLDRIPVWSLPRHYVAIIGIGYFFTFYDITDIGFAMPAIEDQFHLTGSESLFVALAVGLAGYVFGSLVIGTLADRYGRYRMLILTLVLTAVGSFGDAASVGVVSLSVFRFITGVGVGADLNLVSTYIGELAPAGMRGRISVYTFLVGILGQAVTPFIALGLVPNLHVGWRVLFGIGGIIAAIGLAARMKLPASPRWLVMHGRVAEADRVVTRMERTADRRGVRLPEPRPHQVSTRFERFPMRALFQGAYGRRLAIFVPMWFLWYIGNYGFLGDAATLLKEHGSSAGSSILYLAIGSVGYPVGAAVMARTVERVERKLLILASTVVWAAGMLLVGTNAGLGYVIGGAFLASLALGSYLQVAYTFTAESFPTRARASGFAFGDGLGHAGGVVGALLLPTWVSAVGFFGGFAVIAGTGVSAGLLALLGPSATGHRLERVSA